MSAADAAKTPGECFQRVFDALERTGCRPRLIRDGEAKALCPRHRDIKPSLGLKQTAVGALLTCFARCPRHEVEKMLGISPGELVAVRTVGRTIRPRTVAEYPYQNVIGTVVAVKARREPKAFRWRLPSGAYRLDGVSVPIFNQPALVDARRVFVAEGEKATEQLTRLMLPATCPPAGASCWKWEWSSQLWRLGTLEAIILADHDVAGEHHAEAVAAALHGYAEVPNLPDYAEEPWASWPMAERGDPELAPLHAKVVRLHGLPPSGDVVDWFDAGHSRADLLAVVEATPYWTPELLAQQRRDRRRVQTRERVRRHRKLHPRVTQGISIQRDSSVIQIPSVTRYTSRRSGKNIIGSKEVAS